MAQCYVHVTDRYNCTSPANCTVFSATVSSALIPVGGFSYPNIDDNGGSRPVYDAKDPTSADSGPRCPKADCSPYIDLCLAVFNLDAAATVAGSIHFESAIDIVRHSQQGFTSMKCS